MKNKNIFIIIGIILLIGLGSNLINVQSLKTINGINVLAMSNVELETELNSLIKQVEDLEKGIENLEKNVTTAINNSVLVAFPVGSIYITTKNENPSTEFGGTWVAWGAGRTIVGVDSSQTEFDTVEKVGGAKTHVLTVAQMPSHNHSVNAFGGWGAGALDTGRWRTDQNSPANNWTASTTSSGGGQAHNNLQPYITTYMWKRTA